MATPGIIISGTGSGCGKTTVTAGIIAALAGRSLRVQPFKTGPDYIDPMFHAFLSGRPSRNLDSWLLDEETVGFLFAEHARSADMAVVEGAMGLFDGFGGRNEAGSTAHVARITGLPVVLVVNPEGMALSVAAMVKGFLEFDPHISLKGVIFNNVDSENYFRLLKSFVEDNADVRVLGYLRRNEAYSLGERHLGLVTASEIADLKQKAESLRAEIEKTVDIAALLQIAHGTKAVNAAEPAALTSLRRLGHAKRPDGPRIAVAYDKAFSFYYRDNLELMEQLGAELVYFSPLEDKALPARIDGLYIGGGYPELHAGKLAGNRTMRKSVKEAIEQGVPAYAECGGLMYLGGFIDAGDGTRHEMAGVIPGISRMTSSLKRFGYVEVEAVADCSIAQKGAKIRAHEFHFSEMELFAGVDACWHVTGKNPGGGHDEWDCGYRVHNLVAGYPHLHFLSNPGFAERFVGNCCEYGQKHIGGKR